MKAVILVPWRGGNDVRDRLYRVVRPYLEAYGWGILEGDSEGPWSRGRAINAAARAAGDWDVALLNDGDTVGTREVVERAASMAVKDGAAYRPHDRLFQLSPEQTHDFQFLGLSGVILNSKTRTHLGGGLMVVSREAWEAVGGYDDRFVEWGHEDSDLNTRLLAGPGWDVVQGDAYHLWHPRDGTRTAEVMANRARMRETQILHGDAIREASEERGWDVGRVL